MTGQPNPLYPVTAPENDRLSFALKAAGVGAWDFDPAHQQIWWDERCGELFGFSKEADVTYQQILGAIYNDDREWVLKAVQTALDPHAGGEFAIRFRLAGQPARWLYSQGKAYFNEQGIAYRFSGIVHKVAEEADAQQQLEVSEARFLKLIEEATVATCLFVGRDLKIEIVNDRMLGYWRKDRSVLGKSPEEALPELKGQAYSKRLEEVFTTGQPYEARAAQAELDVDGVRNTYYFDLSYMPVRNAADQVYGVLATSIDVTEQVFARKAVEESEAKLRSIIATAPAAMGLFVGRELIIDLPNQAFIDIVGKGPDVAGKPLREVMPELESQAFLQILDDVYTSGTMFQSYGTQVNIVQHGVMTHNFYNITYTPLLDAEGRVYAILDIAIDVTEAIKGRQQLEESELFSRTIIENSPVAKAVFVGEDMRINTVNEKMLEILGRDASMVGKPLLEAIPELAGTSTLALLQMVYRTGETYYEPEAKFDLLRKGQLTTGYYTFTFKALRNTAGVIYGIINTCIDVTAQVYARLKLEESELFSRSLFEHSPVAKMVLSGEDLEIRTSNENMLTLLGRDTTIIGKTILAALPELTDTPLIGQLRQVFTSGETVHQPEVMLVLMRYGQPYVGYYSTIYKPLWDAGGKLYGLMITAIEVTQQIRARQKVEEAEESLRGALELAQLATWSMDSATGNLVYDDRMKEWTGDDKDQHEFEKGLRPIPPVDRARIRQALQQAVQSGSTGIYDEEHLLENIHTGQRRVIHAQAKAYFDRQGKPYKLTGTALDITEQRQIQLKLEQQVQERTEELAAINEEMAATNEELATINDGLNESNELLARSNENLQQFAYIASHDLQEPLRKIQSFSDILKQQYANQLGDGARHLDRMEVAAQRMSTLIRDLLAFSRVSMRQETTNRVSLTSVINTVLTDLDLIIEETGAIISVAGLPTLQGDRSQLEQLFQNLLSNALKFRRTDASGNPIRPVIHVSVQRVTATDLPPAVKPTRMTRSYHHISVTDNGIGFDQKYTDRIFQVFQRLHGKSEYAGTGIGLAICEKVTSNHGGAITATSQPGQGATFSVYFPVSQTDATDHSEE